MDQLLSFVGKRCQFLNKFSRGYKFVIERSLLFIILRNFTDKKEKCPRFAKGTFIKKNMFWASVDILRVLLCEILIKKDENFEIGKRISKNLILI